MATVYIAPTFGVGFQAFDAAGVPLNAGLLYSYSAGTTTPLATYTASDGVTPNANPIVLGADGRPPNEIWMTAVSYRFDLKDSLGNTLASFDNVPSGFVSASTLAASTGAAGVGFIQSGTSPTVRTAQSKMRDIVDARDFLPSGYATDASVDYTTELGRFFTEAAGRHGQLPKGKLLHTGLTMASSMSLAGESADFNSSTNVTSLVYSGTGAGLTVQTASAKIYNPSIRNLRLEATGSATTGANAIGLKLVNCNYGTFQNLVVRGFGGGTALLATATSGLIGGANAFLGCFLWGNLVGYKFDGVAAGYGDFASTIHGGSVIGVGTATSGCKCLWVTQYAAELAAFGTDFETAEYIIDLYGNASTNGGGVKLIGTRSEFMGTRHIRINSTTDRTLLIGHRFAGGSSADWLDDQGTNTVRHDADANVVLHPSDLTMANNIPLYMQDSGGTQRQVMKLASNDTLQVGFSTGNGNFTLGQWIFQASLTQTRSAPTYGTSVAINAALGNFFDITVTDGVGFTVANPSNARDGQEITITIRNASGGAAGTLTFDTLYKAASWTQPANGNSRSISFKYNGTNWVEFSRTTADVPN